MSPPEWATTSGVPNKGMDERWFITSLSALLTNMSMPSFAIVDTSRNAVQGIRLEWGDWCNVDGAGIGARPKLIIGEQDVDAFVWVDSPGMSDGGSERGEKGHEVDCEKIDGESN
jgi:cellulose 1,4-beta-cellobiosidase